MAENKKAPNFIGYVEMPRLSCKVRFTLAELEEMKKFATAKGNVFVDIVLSKDKERDNHGNSWAAVKDPSEWEKKGATAQVVAAPEAIIPDATGDALPF